MTREPLDESLIDTLRLVLTPGVGPLTYGALVKQFGSPRAVLRAPAAQLERMPGVGAKIVEGLRKSLNSSEAKAVLESCQRYSVDVVGLSSEQYPRLIREIPDPPPVLYIRGRILPADQVSIALVGSRQPTSYGVRVAERLGRELAAAGFTVVSGLARGVDAAAHRGALQAGRTVGVLGGGVLNIYPPEHVKLADKVVSGGALMSESPPFHPPRTGSFPRRNRLITGLTLGVVVVEASQRSGALISARHAAEQGREVFAVPGRIDNATARGCHRLIQDGAKLVESIDDVLEELGPLVQPAERVDGGGEIRHPAELKLSEVERAVLDQTPDEATNIDEVIARTELSTPQVLAAVSALEMRRLIRRVSGCRIVRV